MGAQIKQLFDLNKNKPLLFVLIVAVFVGIFYSLNLVLFTITLYLLYKSIGPLLDKSAFNSYFFKGLFVIFFFMVLLQSIILTSWLFVRNFPLDEIIPLAFIVMLLLYIAKLKLTKEKSAHSLTLPVLHVFDIVAIIMSLAIFFSVIFSSHIFTNELFNNNFHFLISGSDDSTHQKMFEQKIIYNKGVINQTSVHTRVSEDSFYPTGWHAANAAITQAFYPSISPGNQTLVAYAISKLFWFFVLLVIFCRTVLILYKRVIKNKLSLINQLWLICSLYIIGRLTVGGVYEAGAYSFIPQLISGLLIIVLLLQFSQRKNELTNQQGNLFLITITAIGGCLSWVLVLPAFSVAILSIAILTIRNTQSWKVIRGLFTKPLYVIPLFISVTAVAAQLYIMFSPHPVGTSVSFVDGINLSGPVVTRGVEFYIFLVVGLVICLSVLYRLDRTYFKYLLLALIPLFVFSQLISVIQIMTVGINNYYYFKVLTLLLVLILPLSIVGFMFLIDKLEHKKLNLVANLLFISLFILSISFFARIVLHVF
jgi:hypothetical protein